MATAITPPINSIETSPGRRPLEFCTEPIEVATKPVVTHHSTTKNGMVNHFPRAIESNPLHQLTRLPVVTARASKQNPYV